MLAVGELTAVQASFGLSTSVESRSPVAVGDARRAIGDTAGLSHGSSRGPGNHGQIIGAVDGDGDQLGGAVHCPRRERVGQRLPDIERLYGRIAVIERVGPHAGGSERIAAVGTRGRRVDRGPGVGIVDVGRVQIAGCSGDARRAIGDTAGFGHRPAGDAGNHRRVVGAIDGDGHQLRRTVDRADRERIGQRLPDIERLHGGVVVVECVGPHPGSGECVGSVAAGTGRSPC